MKNIESFVCLIFMSLSITLGFSGEVSARTRAYRINPESTTSGGFAIAWGVRDVDVDFEAIEQSDDSINAFLLKYDTQIVNYIVDVERESIISEIRADGYWGHIGNLKLGNNFSLNLNEISKADGLELNQIILTITANYKWDNSLTDAYLVSKTSSATTLIKHYDLLDDIHVQIISSLSLYEKKIIENKALNYLLSDDKSNQHYYLSINGYVPKCESDCEIVNMKSEASFSVTPDAFKMILKNLVFEIQRE
jgi:predicted DNA-binding ribbon-helix-helix protein